jgi:hypothetical protein
MRLWSAEEWAYAGLLATVCTIAFSIALGQLLAGLMFLAFVVAAAKRQVRVRLPAVVWFAVAFALVAAATSWLNGGGHGLWKRTGKLLWFALIPVTASLVRSPERTRGTLWAFLFGCAALGVKNLIRNPIRAWRQPVSPDYLTSLIDKGSMTDGQMLMLGLVGALVLWWGPLREGERVAPWRWPLMALQGAGLLINFKRGSWFCAALLAGGVVLAQCRWRTWVLAALIAAGVLALPPVRGRLGQLRTELNAEGGGRLTMWTRVVPYWIRAHPAGIGYGCLTNEMMREADPKVEKNRNHVHANWGQVLVETGWLGLGVYLAWMVKALADAIAGIRRLRAVSSGDRALAIATLLMLTGLLLNGLVEYNFGDTELMFVYAWLMGLAGGRLEAAPCPGAPDQHP